MKLSEMRSRISGLPEGMSGERIKWDEMRDTFEIVKACIIARKKYTDTGEVLTYSKGRYQGEPIMDRQLALMIRAENGRMYIVRTNSQRLIPLFAADIEDGRGPDGINSFGDEYYFVVPPEGKLRFISSEYKYADGTIGKVADLAEAD